MTENLVNRRKFSEKRLVDLIVAAPAPVGQSIVLEFDCSAGRADVVYFCLRRSWRQAADYASIPPRWLYALRSLPYRRKFTTAAFCALAGVTGKTANLVLRRYSRYKFCESGEKGSWFKVRQPLPIVTNIVAVEAKLHDWSRALAQAYRYLDYAHETWVALDSKRSSGATRAINRFKRLNVGLYTVDRDGRRRIIFRPRRNQPKSPIRFWEANAIISRAVKRSGARRHSLNTCGSTR